MVGPDCEGLPDPPPHELKVTAKQIAVAVACALQLLAFAQLTLPITPPDRIHSLGLDTTNELFADSVGWEDVAHEVESLYVNLPD